MVGPTGDIAIDTAFLQTIFTKGGIVPPGRWRFRGPLLYPLFPARISMEGVTLEYVEPQPWWDSGFAICSLGYTLPGRPRSVGVTLDFGRTGHILIPKNGCIAPRKGLGVTDSDRIIVLNPRVFGAPRPGVPDRSLFAMQIHNSSDVLIRGGQARVESEHEGTDGLHATGTCRRVRIEELSIRSGDDATSLTHEMAQFPGAVQEDFDFVHCSIDNVAHSAIKCLTIPGMGAPIIRRVRYQSCDLKTSLGVNGQGAPILIDNQAGTIEDVVIVGGRLRHIVPEGGGVSEPLISLRGIKRFDLRDTQIDYYGRTLLRGVDSPGIVFQPRRADLIAPVGGMSVPRGLVDLTRCPGSYIDTSQLTRSWPTQQLLQMSSV